MIKVTSKVKLNSPMINQLTKAAIVALEETAEALHTDVVQSQVVPFDKGTLQGEAFFVDTSESANGVVRLVHNTPYARRLYYHPEYNFQTTENPNARGKWFEDWEPGGAKSAEVAENYERLLRRLTN